MENLKDPPLCRDIKHWARDHPAGTFQDVCLEVHHYMEEDPVPKRSTATREALVGEDEVLCGEVAGQNRQWKVLEDLIYGQKERAEEMQKKQKLLMTHIDQQRKVLNRQQDTHNQLLATLVSRPGPTSCYRCGQDGHFVHNCPKPAPVSIQGGKKPAQRRRQETRRLHRSEPGGGGA